MVSKFGALGFAVASLTIGLAIPTQASAQPAGCPPVEKGVIKTCNTAEPRNDGYWNWDLFLVSDEDTLKRIRCVEYTLHPTFPKPVRSVCTKGNKAERGFVLQTAGWGTFRVQIKVRFTDGSEQYLSHNLVFD
jgi:transcription initiation factor IIF auxiliary subunit